MKRLFVCVNSVSADLRLYELDMTDDANWTVSEVGQQPILGVEGNSAAMSATCFGDHLYLAWRGSNPAILTYRMDPAKRSFDLIGNLPIKESCCYLSTSQDGRFLLAAGDDKALSIRISRTGVAEELISRTHLGSMAHCLIVHQDRAFGTACRDDLLRAFSFDREKGTLTETGSLAFPKESGPRHIAIAPEGDRLFVVTQEGGSVAVISTSDVSRLSHNVKLTRDDTEPLAGDIAISEDGQFLFVTERTTQSIFSLRAGNQSQAPSLISRTVSPEHARVACLSEDNSFLIALGFRDQTGRVYAVESDGSLSQKVDFSTGDRPSWVLEL
ncbi:beta-propeller fold lactonase family protein [uncultured Cohaesibacter sp.]|uniref:lactonase family protein n=1 Tax=uncultured Cohaesibacter sp. TaxID=1002546 RepID=UPI00292CCEC4|nr:beta-propeller fold lactonase family protein [uncultured Cohaesibacter sp.]